MQEINKIFSFIEKEKKRQINGIELIASENYVSENVLKAQGSILTNKYAEGYPDKRYYGGCQYIDSIEKTTISLAQELFKTDYKVNVQPHSGSSANMAVYLATLKPGDTILGLSLNAGGHLTHGSKPSFSGEKYGIFNSISYGIKKDGTFDFDNIKKLALKHKPKIIVAGASAYARKIDWKKFKAIADAVGAYLLADIAHIAGLVATDFHDSPFGIADFITTTTHKTLRGPRGGMIFSKTEEFGKKIDSAIFPGIQGGPLEHIIAAKGVCFAEALKPEYKLYIEQVIKNAKTFEEELLKGNINLIGNGTDNHLLLLDFSNLNLSGTEVEQLLLKIDITTNKNTVPGDLKPWDPSGLRIGTPAITSRGIKEKEIKIIANAILDSINLYIKKKENGVNIDFELNNIRIKMNNLVKNKSIYPLI